LNFIKSEIYLLFENGRHSGDRPVRATNEGMSEVFSPEEVIILLRIIFHISSF
jgi:hypothetical protein